VPARVAVGFPVDVRVPALVAVPGGAVAVVASVVVIVLVGARVPLPRVRGFGMLTRRRRAHHSSPFGLLRLRRARRKRALSPEPSTENG